MKHAIALLLFLVVAWGAVPVHAQRGGGSDSGATAVALLPTCSRTTGYCPRDGYMCRNANDYDEIWTCTISGGWNQVGAGLLEQVSSVPSTCSTGEFFQVTSAVTGSQFYYCESGTPTQISGSGGGVTTLADLTDTSVTTPAIGELLLWDGQDWANKTMQTDASISSTGAVTIAADAVALGTDTTGNYVDDATTDGGLLLTGTEGATLGLREDCTTGYGLTWDGDSWDCADVAGGGGGSAVILDIQGEGDDPESTDISEIEIVGNVGTLFDEPSANVLQINVGQAWPTATALAANPSACSAGQFVSDLDADGTLTCATPADLTGVTQLAVTGDADEVQLTVNGKLSGQTASVMEIYGDHDADGDLDAWFSLRDAAYTMNGPTIINNLYAQDTNNVTLTVKGNTSQNTDILLVQTGASAELLSVNATDGVVIGDIGGNGGGIELVDEDSACDTPASGSTTICTIGGVPHVNDAGVTSPIGASATHTECFVFYDADGLSDGMDIASIWKAPEILTVSEVWCESDGTTGCAINFQRDDGAEANLLSSNKTCTSTAGVGTIDGAEDTFADGDRLDFVMVSAGDCDTLSVCVEYTYD